MSRLSSLGVLTALSLLIACDGPTTQDPTDTLPLSGCTIDADCGAGICVMGACVGQNPGDGDGDDGLLIREPPAGDGDIGDGDGDIGDGDGDGTCQGAMPGAAPARLLTRAEFDRTVHDLLFLDDALAAALFPPENVALGFENNADSHQASPAAVQAFLDVAEALAEAAVDTRLAQIAPCAPSALASGDSAETTICATLFVDEFAPRAFRRPLEADERTVFINLMADVVPTEGLETGISWTIQAALQSPQFLYRVQRVQVGESAGETVALDGYEVASRLSYLLWGTMPDDALFAAAEAGTLNTAEGVQAEAERLLADPRAEVAVIDFARQWLQTERLIGSEKDAAEDLGLTSEAIGESLRDSLHRFIAWAALESDDSLEALLASDTVFVDDTIAPLVGVTAPGGMSAMSLDGEVRAGLLTQPALMAILSHPDQSSPIQRGIFVREELLCEHLPDPPADIVIEPPNPDPNATTRERFAEHTENPDCQACHVLIDPIGFGFESYDELGRFRTEENGLPIDASGSLLFTTSSQAIEGDFDGAVELSQRLATAPQVAECVADRWFTWANGRGAISEADRCNLERAQDAFFDGGNNMKAFLIALATSDATRLRPSVEHQVPDAFVPPDLDMTEPEPEPDMEPEPDPGCMGGSGTPPQGHLDSINASGVARGWALDADAQCYAVFVHVYMDGPAGSGTLLYPQIRADQPRPDVNNALNVTGEHGFVFALPPAALDGAQHTLYFYAIDTSTDGNVQIGNSPFTFTAGGGDALPVGVIDNVSAAGVANGWAYDPSNPAADLTLEIYLDAPSFLGGQLLGTTTTGQPRPDVNNVFGITGNQGWSYTLPPAAQGDHVLYVEALDLSNNGNRAFLDPDGYAYEVTP
jgi:hypothetical protein